MSLTSAPHLWVDGGFFFLEWNFFNRFACVGVGQFGLSNCETMTLIALKYSVIMHFL